ncbi:hypothetical protein A2777_00765 [Candidatus Gottesmanbacteria bacterium RIFCSPHIGHO2_01_FULL_40_15]|uniref:Uncharacterized protein n=1 Tax=Candidatus Gottesmanbacteria bacterium RIFCSPHIGHO2_01_FULL_40_15 TaxID=1798376 RepID=A0A1F5Z108_9BACT|nr:MAG: hypothetical protein A2777_00765 [Candidatus Gottesmanbacteria bacterium RIFCSPHIGHO2_01_FULL_40_15]
MTVAPELKSMYFDITSLTQQETPEWLFENNELGITPLQLHVRLLKPLKTGAYPDRRFLFHLFKMTESTDRDMMENQPEWVERGFFTVKYTSDEVAKIQNSYLQGLKEIYSLAKASEEGDNIRFAFPLYGAMPIMARMNEIADKELREVGIRKEQLLHAPIWGTQGASTGGAQVDKTINPELLKPENYIVLSDDVLDSGVSAIQLGIARRLKRLGLEELLEKDYGNLVSDIRELRGQGRIFDDRQLVEKFARAAKLLREERIIVAPLFCKNQPFNNLLIQEVKTNFSEYDGVLAVMQDRANRKTNLIGESEWIMGGVGGWDSGYPLLDTGVNGAAETGTKKVKGILYYTDPEYETILIKLGLDKLFLRVGAGIKDLVVFNAKKYDELVWEVAKNVNAYMEYTVDQGLYSDL